MTRSTIVTIWHDQTMLKRLTPVSDRFVVPLPVTTTATLPPLLRNVFTISAWTPGFRYAETRVPAITLRPVPAPIPVPVP